MSSHFTHKFSESASGICDSVAPWLIWPIIRRGFVIVRIAFVYCDFIQTDADVGDPALHVHPFSMKHPESHPSPSLTFPSSHSYSNLFPSPQIYGQKADAIPRMFTFSILNPATQSVHSFSFLHLLQYSLHFWQPDVELKNPLGQFLFAVHLPAAN